MSAAGVATAFRFSGRAYFPPVTPFQWRIFLRHADHDLRNVGAVDHGPTTLTCCTSSE
jgi:hypothetical protein